MNGTFKMPIGLKNVRVAMQKMPNWCSNKTTIQGSYNELESLIGCNFDFETLRPRPPNEDDWYEWNIAHWGTKWNRDPECVCAHDEGTQTLTIRYRTAWSPPNSLLKYLSEEKQLHIRNRFIDEAYGFVGYTEILNGEEHTEFIEPSAHSDEYVESYAANHDWFPYEDWCAFNNAMLGLGQENP
jgi:hypothetical protein